MWRLTIIVAALGLLVHPMTGSAAVIPLMISGTAGSGFFGSQLPPLGWPFDVRGWVLTASGDQTDFAPTGDIIGGQRHTAFIRGLGTPALAHGIDDESRVGWLTYYAHGGQATWSVEYGNGGDLDANMVYAARTMFSVEIPYKNIADAVPLSITVTSDRGTQTEATQTVTEDIVGTVDAEYGPGFPLNMNPMVVKFPYSAFDGIDFSDVDYIRLRFDAGGPALVAW